MNFGRSLRSLFLRLLVKVVGGGVCNEKVFSGISKVFELIFEVGVFLVVVYQFFGFPARISSDSMFPTLRAGDVQISSTLARHHCQSLWSYLAHWIWAGEMVTYLPICDEGFSKCIRRNVTLSLMTALVGLRVFELKADRHKSFVPLPNWAVQKVFDRFAKKPHLSADEGPDVPMIEVRIRGADWVWIDRCLWRFKALKRFEVVAFRLPRSMPWARQYPGLLAKRAVGLSSECVEILDDGALVIDGLVIPLDSIPSGVRQHGGYWNQRRLINNGLPPVAPLFPCEGVVYRVRPGHLLLLGDHSRLSIDGRLWGAIPRQAVEGVVLLRLWPFAAFATNLG